MEYLPKELKNEYDFMIQYYPDIEGLEHPYMNMSDAFKAYFILVDYFTDPSTDDEREQMMVGIRSIDLLASALCRQNVSFMGTPKYTNPLDICATLFFGIVKNHSFNDGNKRTGLLLLLYQLQLYGYDPIAPQHRFEDLVLHVAAGNIETSYPEIYNQFKMDNDPVIRTLSYLLRQMTAKRDDAFHVNPTMKVFCSSLENCGVKYHIENGNAYFMYSIPEKTRVFPAQSFTYVIPFHGWTRPVGAETVRDALIGLGLYDQYPDYHSLFSGCDSMYELVDDFKEPFRRLKDE